MVKKESQNHSNTQQARNHQKHNPLSLKQRVEQYFQLPTKGSNIKTEFLAGFTIFLSMLYAIPVSAEILSQAGMPKEALITAITLITILSTLVCGIYANTPVAMSVGMGLNAYFTYGVVQGYGISWQQGLGIVFVSGLIFALISLSNFRVWILKSIPKNLRFAFCVGLGAFLATIGLKGLEIFTLQNDNLLLGDLSHITTLLGIVGIMVALVLYILKVKGAFILTIALLSGIGFLFEIAQTPTQIFSSPASIAPIALELDVFGILKFTFVPVILMLMVTDLFDSLGTLSGIGIKANLFYGLDHTERDTPLERTLQIDAVATMAGGLLGTSTTTSFLESASGTAAGGRSGLSAVFAALFFCLTLFILPLFLSIPSFAIYPILVVIGAFMFLEISHIDFSDTDSLIASFFIILLMPLTTSITIGLSAGFLVYLLLIITQGHWSKISGGLLCITFLSVIPFIF
ncbi:NCS2 family permease [uncultured Helicobacter sp.]|uniref:NCS2 family permease n=1 Tax=uncultured Helicobacter sp. TaxID=175537 RepID=UPI00261CC42A|nr:NCS2 family permease [uncultured Helicobacter sp.]